MCQYVLMFSLSWWCATMPFKTLLLKCIHSKGLYFIVIMMCTVYLHSLWGTNTYTHSVQLLLYLLYYMNNLIIHDCALVAFHVAISLIDYNAGYAGPRSLRWHTVLSGYMHCAEAFWCNQHHHNTLTHWTDTHTHINEILIEIQFRQI